ncbi:SGNH/GDSL hydrolase family protein [Frigoribacterium salinisoli]
MRAVTRRVASQVLGSRLRALGGLPTRLPRQPDVPFVHAAGPDPDRVLVVGCGPTLGRAVGEGELALPTQLTRLLSSATGRGSFVEADAATAVPLAEVVAVLGARDLSAHDAVVVVLGQDDAAAVSADRTWTALVHELVATVQRVGSASTELVVVGLQPSSLVPALRVAPGSIADRWVEELGELTLEALLEADGERDLVAFVPAPSTPTLDDDDATLLHRRVAERIVRVLAPRLTRHAEEADRGLAPSRAARLAPQSIARLLADPTAQRLRGADAGPRFDAIVAHARTLFGTESAAFSVLDDEVQHNAARAGTDERGRPIEASLCSTTITASRPYVVSASSDGSDVLVPESDLRFYAGYPVESPDGVRIGALCVFDSHPRDPSSVDVDLLRDLALAIQREVWGTPAGGSAQDVGQDPAA